MASSWSAAASFFLRSELSSIHPCVLHTTCELYELPLSNSITNCHHSLIHTQTGFSLPLCESSLLISSSSNEIDCYPIWKMCPIPHALAHDDGLEAPIHSLGYCLLQYPLNAETPLHPLESSSSSSGIAYTLSDHDRLLLSNLPYLFFHSINPASAFHPPQNCWCNDGKNHRYKLCSCIACINPYILLPTRHTLATSSLTNRRQILPVYSYWQTHHFLTLWHFDFQFFLYLFAFFNIHHKPNLIPGGRPKPPIT